MRTGFFRWWDGMSGTFVSKSILMCSRTDSDTLESKVCGHADGRFVFGIGGGFPRFVDALRGYQQ